MQGRGLQCVGSVANENQNELRGFYTDVQKQRFLKK